MVKWFPGMKLDTTINQIYENAIEYYPTLVEASRALGVSEKTLQRVNQKLEAERKAEEASMSALVASQNEAILRFKRMSAPTTMAQERALYQQIVQESNNGTDTGAK
jgi:hypothetical protein